jgi:hypothetical protein
MLKNEKGRGGGLLRKQEQNMHLEKTELGFACLDDAEWKWRAVLPLYSLAQLPRWALTEGHCGKTSRVKI